MPGPRINGVEVESWRRDLSNVPPELEAQVTEAHKTIAKLGAEGARGIAYGMGGIQSRAAAAIRPQGNRDGARIAVQKSSRNPMANVAFWGAKRRSGWYAAAKYEGSGKKQFPEWVGNTWDVATYDGGPYAINRALFFDLPELMNTFDRMIDEATRKAFPD